MRYFLIFLFALKGYGISLFCLFLFCKIRTLTGYYKYEIYHFVANFPSYNSTKYYKNRSTFVCVITEIKRVNFFESRCIYGCAV